MTFAQLEQWLEYQRRMEAAEAEARRNHEFVEQAKRLERDKAKFAYEAEAQAAKTRYAEQGPLPEIESEEKKRAVFAFLERVEEQEKNIADSLKKLGYAKGAVYDWEWRNRPTKTGTSFELFALQVSVQNAAICGAAMDMLALCGLDTPQRAVEINAEYQQRVTKRKADTDVQAEPAPTARACGCMAKPGTCITARCACHKAGLPCGSGCRCTIAACNAVWQADVARGKSCVAKMVTDE